MTVIPTLPQTFDVAQAFQLDGLDVRGRLVRLGPTVNEILGAHDYPAPVAELLAEALVLGATLASTVKFEGQFTLQIQSDGPISLLLADLTSAGELRGYARFDADRVVAAAKSDGAKVPRLLGRGTLAFTVDQGQDMDRYQGVVALEGATLAACAQSYFRISEQLETVIFLGTQCSDTTHTAGAVLIQRMPQDKSKDVDEAEEEWRRVVVLLSSLKLDELLDPALDPDDILYRLYHDDGVRAYAPKKLVYKCRCSRKKVITTLQSLPRHEIIGDDGSAHVNCEFCTIDYDFTATDLDQIYGESND